MRTGFPGKIGHLLGGIALMLAPAAAGSAPSRTAAAAKTVGGQTRFVALQGGENFRDIGGYRARDGRRVKWGLIYRSGTMHKLTGADFERLKSRGIRSIIDLRASDERTGQPLGRHAGFSPFVYAKPYSLVRAGISAAIASPNTNADRVRVAFDQFYTTLPFEFAEQYRQMFAQLLDRRVPMIVNCTAGKDRTGVAMALLLSALGVPRDVIVKDYLLSNAEFQPRPAHADPRMSSLPPDIVRVLEGVEARFLQAAFKTIESRPGGLNGYFRNELGLKPADLRRLRTLYLQQ